jgi:hypothetical protein
LFFVFFSPLFRRASISQIENEVYGTSSVQNIQEYELEIKKRPNKSTPPPTPQPNTKEAIIVKI